MEAIFRALGDPSRRVLLDRLFERDGQTLGELSARLDMTRFGAMKHLRILEAAGLVTTRRAGREKHHYLNPVPIRLIHDRWISKFAAPWVGALGDLKRTLEEDAMTPTTETANGEATLAKETSVRAPHHVYEVYIRTSADKLWQAITRPEFTRDYFYGTLVESTWEPGSKIVYKYPDGTIAADGEVLEVEPNKRLVHTFNATWDESVTPDSPNRVTYTIEPMGAVCRLIVEHDEFAGETATYKSVSGGLSIILNGLKTLLETGEPLPMGGQ